MPRILRSKAVPLILIGALLVILGAFVGLSGYTFTYARGASYLSDDPQTCINCHVMEEQYDAWMHSSHRAAATCNDCHTPHNFVGKWFSKAENGYRHALAFTTGIYPETIHIREHNADIVQQNCLDCHEPLLDQPYSGHGDPDRRCVECHGNVGHPNRSTQ